ncbi:MAG TPA: DinB family protein [Candidatus Bathyarchaeia archaeon]|nr:DinB family protein [Candidatus Bathyarchaeia archaeon]
MLTKFLTKAIKRHFDETNLLIEQITDELLEKKAAEETRDTIELILHMIRSIEYYSRGLTKGIWESLPYTREKYSTSKEIIKLYLEVTNRVMKYLEEITDEDLDKKITEFNRPATMGEILLEMLEHSIHHRGQLTVYYRMNNIKPAKIDYFI